VNDSPALKQANIGCSMGISGSSVSKQAADLILLDDNFASIVNGVEEGRLIYDNLKKSIAYKLTANTAELIPFVFYVLGGLPLPLTTLLILCIDVGADIFPAISMSYEEPEPDLMERGPRDPKTEHLVNARLLVYSYLVVGMIQGLGALLVFIWVLAEGNNYGNGFPPSQQFGLLHDFQVNTSAGNSTQYYSICRIQQRLHDGTMQRNLIACNDDINYLNNRTKSLWLPYGDPISAIKAGVFVDWCYNDAHIDAVQSCQVSGTWSRSYLLTLAQSAYFIAVIQIHWACLLATKTRKVSIFTQGLRNWVLNAAFLFETCFAVFIVFTPGVQMVFGTGTLHPEWLAMFIPWFVFILVFDEVRKFFIRRWPNGYFFRHTYY